MGRGRALIVVGILVFFGCGAGSGGTEVRMWTEEKGPEHDWVQELIEHECDPTKI